MGGAAPHRLAHLIAVEEGRVGPRLLVGRVEARLIGQEPKVPICHLQQLCGSGVTKQCACCEMNFSMQAPCSQKHDAMLQTHVCNHKVTGIILA